MLYRGLLASLLVTSFFTPAFADTMTPASVISAVTVYPQGAEISRTFDVQLPVGDHVLILNDVPLEVNLASIRLEPVKANQAIKIGAVDVLRITPDVKTANSAERLKLQQQIENVNNLKTEQHQFINNAKTERVLLQSMITSSSAPNDKPRLLPSGEELVQLLDVISARLKALSQSTLNAHTKIRELDKQLRVLNDRIIHLAPKQTAYNRVKIALQSDLQTQGHFVLRYRVQNAGWIPAYDARIDLASKDEPKLALERKALVYQRTPEVWKNVNLTLATSRPGTATAAPVLTTRHVHVSAPVSTRLSSKKLVRAQDKNERILAKDTVEAAANEPSLPIEAAPAANEISGLQVSFTVPGKVSINNNATRKQVKLGNETMAVELSAITAPAQDATAYLSAKFIMPGNAPVLPGSVAIFRNGIYFGQGRLPLLAPGEEHELGLGSDDQIKIERLETARKSSETGIIVNDKVEEYGWQTKIKNLHKRPIAIKVVDQLPVSTDENIKVAMTSKTTKPDETKLDGKRGVLAWQRTMDAGKELEINFGYTITAPKGTLFMLTP